MWPNMMVLVDFSPSSWAVIITSAHWAVRILSGHRWIAHAVVEDLGGSSGEGAEAGVAQPGEEVAHGDAERLGPLPDLEGREAVDVHVGKLRLDGFHHRHVEVAGELGVDAALEAHLGGAPLPRFDAALHDLGDRHQVRVAAQVERPRPLREGAEAAAEVALVGVVDVAVDDVADRVAVDPAPQLVGDRGDGIHLVATRSEEPLDLVTGRGRTG